MRFRRFWALFAGCALAWTGVSLLLAPALSGPDVYFFRDAGWNLAQWGSFESAALPYMHDLAPRFYAHYTPLVPLAFAGYLSVFPRNAYAGTVFNLLLGFAAAAAALFWVLRQPPSRLRDVTAWAAALLSPVFISYDRPESAALILFVVALTIGTRPRLRLVLAGVLVALVFLAHPFAAIVTGIWFVAFFLLHHWTAERRWAATLGQCGLMVVTAFVVLVPIALFYYATDRTSLARFAAHALGMKTGLGVALASRSEAGFVHALRTGVFNGQPLGEVQYLAALLSCCLLGIWALVRRRQLGSVEWFPVLAGLACFFFSIALFPAQPNYMFLLAFAVPAGLLIAGRHSNKLAAPALAMLLIAIFSHVPGLATNLVLGYEQRASYLAARQQPSFLRAHLASPDAVVVLQGDSYDLFKPEFRHLVGLDYVDDDTDRFAEVGGVANCYDTYLGEAGPVRPLPAQLNAAEFHMIQPAPQHLWISILGHRVMHRQWGYGCDLYVRSKTDAAAGAN